MSEFEDFNILEAINYLKEGYVIKTNPKSFQTKTMFFLKNDKVYYYSLHFQAPISLEEFRNEFSNYSFSLCLKDETVVDPKKDEEYYSWGKKM